MRRKLVIVGEAPSRVTDGGPPFAGRSGIRLARFFGMDVDELRAQATLTNLLSRWPGPGARSTRKNWGSAFPMAEARTAASLLWSTFDPDTHRVIFVGKRVAAAFGFKDLEWLRWTKRRGMPVAVVPHPSGVSRMWNQELTFTRARRFLRRARS